jgi:hypothetical protein
VFLCGLEGFQRLTASCIALNGSILPVLQVLGTLPEGLAIQILRIAWVDEQLDVLPVSLHHLTIDAEFPAIRSHRSFTLDFHSQMIRRKRRKSAFTAIMQAVTTSTIGLRKLDLTHIPVSRIDSLLQLISATCRSAQDVSLSFGDSKSSASEMQAEIIKLDSMVALMTGIESLSLTVKYGRSFKGFRGLPAPSSIANLRCLTHLSLGPGFHHMDLPEMILHTTSLQSLYLTGNAHNCHRKLQELTPLCSLTALTKLTLNCCEGLLKIPPLLSLSSLQWFELEGCKAVQDLPPLCTLTALQTLILCDLWQLRQIPSLSTLTALTRLDLSSLSQIETIPLLATLTALQVLKLNSIDSLQQLPPLATLTALQTLELRYNRKLRRIPTLISLTALRRVELFGCEQLLELPSLYRLTRLWPREIRVRGRLQRHPYIP